MPAGERFGGLELYSASPLYFPSLFVCVLLCVLCVVCVLYKAILYSTVQYSTVQYRVYSNKKRVKSSIPLSSRFSWGKGR
jgi:hypothetical protein